MKLKFFIALAFAAHICAAQETPAPKIYRAFPAQGTVHQASIKNNITPELPSAKHVFDLKSPANQKLIADFKTPRSHGHIEKISLESATFNNFLDLTTGTIEKISYLAKKTSELSIEFQLSNPECVAVVVINFEKSDDKISAEIIINEHPGKTRPEITNLLRAALIDESCIQKHWGKVLLGTITSGLIIPATILHRSRNNPTVPPVRPADPIPEEFPVPVIDPVVDPIQRAAYALLPAPDWSNREGRMYYRYDEIRPKFSFEVGTYPQRSNILDERGVVLLVNPTLELPLEIHDVQETIRTLNENIRGLDGQRLQKIYYVLHMNIEGQYCISGQGNIILCESLQDALTACNFHINAHLRMALGDPRH